MKPDRHRMWMGLGATGRSMLAGAVLASGACWAADPATPPPTPSAPAPPPEPKVGPAGGTIGRSMSDGFGGLLRSDTMRSGAIADIERPAAPAAKAKAAKPTEPADETPRGDPPRVKP
ncbi:hypothetical protein [Variovorax sp. J31P207]|uniref:hypothetical protein n=1 Tax=Variovorax sp. J31P207 TaxID=3053510 RepID=UPI002578D077|nr:hypothetical protein [Variovorax sp. J31P207]MDM0072183.1 hypothetical protein [Variovorax sp. J31P207]